MKEILFGLVYLVVVLFVLRLIGRMLIRWIYRPLVQFCDARGLNASPWGFVIWEALALSEYTARTGYELFFQYWKPTGWMSPELYGWVLLGLAALPLVVMLIKTKVIYFIPLLLVKLLGIPFFLLAFFVGMPEDEEEAANVELSRALDRAAQRGISVPQRGSSAQRGSSHRGDSQQAQTHQESDCDGAPGYMGEKYADQHRASQDSGGYSSSDVGGTPVYYTGDYRPFGAEGDPREYDSDYSPMD